MVMQLLKTKVGKVFWAIQTGLIRLVLSYMPGMKNFQP
jgi:hypothetical protein